MDDFREIDRMTFYEYDMRMKAFRLKRLDQEYLISFSAWQNREISARKKKGKHGSELIYRDFDKFFNYEEKERRILGINEKECLDTPEARFKDYIRRQNGQL